MKRFALLLADERLIPLTEKEVLIGRREECTIRAHDDRLARRHARISLRDGRYWVEDQGGDNGTWVNGERVVEPRALVANDVIECGRQRITVVETSA